MDYLTRTHCPCCGTLVSGAASAVTAASPAEAIPSQMHGKFLSGYASTRTFFSYTRCNACTGLFCPVYYTPAQLDSLYGHQAENMAEVPLEARQRTQSRYAALALRHTMESGEFVEIGSDIGLFAAACAQSGRFNKYRLYEPNIDVHQALATAMAGRDYVISQATFRQEDVPAPAVTLASLIHVLDHLIEPEAMLRSIHSVMKPGAHLFVVTHDAGSALAGILGRRWPPYTLQHPQLFNSAAMKALLQRTGFSITEQVATVNDFSVGHLVRACLAVIGAPNLIPRWSGPLMPIRLGNMATIARRN